MRGKNKIYTLSMTAVMAAVTGVMAPIVLPIGPVPISLTNLVIFLSLYLLGWRMGTVSYVVYLLLGTVGIPVFAGFTGGFGHLLGPTGGYLLGFVPMALIAGLAICKSDHRAVHALGMVAGTALCYALGTLWFCMVTDSALEAALITCVLPFLPADLLKIVVALTVGPMLRGRLKLAGLLD